jgi:hypothetical protein
VAEIDRLHSRVQAAGFTIVIPLDRTSVLSFT